MSHDNRGQTFIYLCGCTTNKIVFKTQTSKRGYSTGKQRIVSVKISVQLIRFNVSFKTTEHVKFYKE